MEKIVNRELTEFISLYTERPMDVIRETATFMTNVARRSNFVIFQSNFGFCDNDTPFTCVVKRTPVTENGERCIFDVEFWSVDWSSFDIEDGPASDKLANEWTLTRPDRIDGWEKLTAKEIIEHDDFTDRRCFANVTTVHGYSLETELFMLLSGYYDPEEPFGINPKTIGLVAVIYREPIYTEKGELL